MSQSLRKAGNGKKGEEGTEEPISAGRQWMEPRFCSWPVGKRRRKRKLPLARRGSRVLRNLVSEAGRRAVSPRRAAEHRTVLTDRGHGFRDVGRKAWVQEVGFSKDRPDIERQANPREAQSSRSQGSSHEGAVRWKATPELVSQDREAGCQTFRGAGPGRPNTGRSFARRSGGWQQCRPPFLLGERAHPTRRPQASVSGDRPTDSRIS